MPQLSTPASPPLVPAGAALRHGPASARCQFEHMSHVRGGDQAVSSKLVYYAPPWVAACTSLRQQLGSRAQGTETLLPVKSSNNVH